MRWFKKRRKEGSNGEVQMSNIKCQLKSQYLMSNFEFCHYNLGI